MNMSNLIKAREIFTKISSEKFPVKISYQIAKFLRNTDDDYEFYNNKFSEIINKYKDNDSNNNQIKINPKFIDECNKEIIELNKIEINDCSLELYLENLENIELTPEEIYWILPFLKECPKKI